MIADEIRALAARCALLDATVADAIFALADRVEAVERDAASKQARIDALMLEYCPDEMTPDQREEWARHQKPAIKE